MAFIKLIAFGDIHGCRRVAETAIQIANDKSVKAVFLGDYVDRGSNSMGVLKVLMEAKEVNPKWVFLRGNHDQMLLDVINGIRYEPYDEETYNKTLLEFNAMDNDFKTKALEFLESTQLYYETNDFIFVHAPLQDDGKILSNKSIEELTWNYSFDPEWKGKPFIHGHYNTQHVDFSTNSININTACGYDGKLTGLLIDEENKTEFEVFYIGEDGTILNEFRVVNSGIHSFRQFSGKTFFYPACGRDILEPIKQCLEIDTFVFNDIHDFSIDIMNELMGAFKLLKMDKRIMTGIQINGYYTKMNFIVFEYTLKPSRGKAFKVVFIVGKGYAVFEYFFRQLNNTLDLFYYRGDGMGDGGSGMIWFKKKRFKPLIEHLTQNGKNGVIITDGSNFSDFKAFKAWQHNSPYADKRKVFTFFSNRTTLYEFTPTKVLRNYLSNGVVKWEVKII